jgi:hypothetical protein
MSLPENRLVDYYADTDGNAATSTAFFLRNRQSLVAKIMSAKEATSNTTHSQSPMRTATYTIKNH